MTIAAHQTAGEACPEDTPDSLGSLAVLDDFPGPPYLLQEDLEAGDLADDRPLLRLAHYEGPDRLPRMPSPRRWFRVVELLRARGEVGGEGVRRMARHLSVHADEHGSLTGMREILQDYAARFRVSVRIGWIDLNRMCDAGLVRQVCGAAPGRKARYVLCLDIAALPDDLPGDLADELRKHVDDPAAAAKGRLTRAQADAALSECETVRYGSATGPKIASQLGCGQLHTSRFIREGSPPSPPPRKSQGSRRPRRLPFGGDFNEEKAHALYFVNSLAMEWARQRPGRTLTPAQMAELAPMVALLLRRHRPNEGRELVVEPVASAGDLAGVLRWRIGRALAAARRAERAAEAIRVDESGGEAFLAAMRQRWAAQGPIKDAVVARAQEAAAAAAIARQEAIQARTKARLQELRERRRRNRATLQAALPADAPDADNSPSAAPPPVDPVDVAAAATADRKAALVELARRRAEEIRQQRQDAPIVRPARPAGGPALPQPEDAPGADDPVRQARAAAAAARRRWQGARPGS